VPSSTSTTGPVHVVRETLILNVTNCVFVVSLCLQAVPYSLSLATIKKFIWKRSHDVVFHYKALDPARLAPFPTFQSPEQ
jgi:hypothetical protein